ncbi:hypothetical protein ACVBGC_13300 [Burkholderia stagnalis]
MRKRLSLSFVPIAVALAAAGLNAAARADEAVQPKQAALLAQSASGTQPDGGFGVVTVSAPQCKTSVTLWDEIAPPNPLPIPIPVSVPQPGDVQHAMQGNTENGTRQ